MDLTKIRPINNGLNMPANKKYRDLSDNNTFAGGFPHEYFMWLRQEHPIFWHEATDQTPDGEGFWVVSRYKDIAAEFEKEGEPRLRMRPPQEKF